MTDTYRLSDRYTHDHGTVFMTGVQALARLPLEQLRVDRVNGLSTAAFIAGYPGSPLGGVDSAMSAAAGLAPDLPIVLRPSLNEEYAATAVMGSQLAASRPDSKYDGVVGLWYGKAPGVDRASDALRHAVFAGTDPNGGAVALVGDDPNAKSSTVPSSSAASLADMHIPVLYPGDPAEALDLGRHAIAMSRATGLWTSLKIVADVADGSVTVDLDPTRVNPIIPLVDGAPYQHSPDGRLLTPHTVEIEREIYEVRYALALEYAALNRLNHTTVDPSDAWIGVVSSGITYREVREALARLGLRSESEIADSGIRLLKLGMPIPFNASTIRSFATGLEQIFVIEEKHPNVENLIKNALYNHTEHPLVVGKFDENGTTLLPGHGSLSADQIMPALWHRLGDRLGHRLHAPPTIRERIPLQVMRTPFFCSGCPHNRSTVVPDGTLVGVGIGCHTMVMLADPDRVGDIAGLTCMGNEGTQWIGMEHFVDTDHLTQNLGDGTYFHSGQLAIQAAIAANSHITYKLLWNSAVAMTGGQNPSGRIELADVAAQLLGQGVGRIILTTEDPSRHRHGRLPQSVEVWDRTRILEAQESLRDTPGVSVMIHDQRCAAEARRDRKRGKVPTPRTRVVINHRICEGCGDCARVSNCLSVQPFETAFGRKTTIDQTSCNLDLSCLEGDCPAFISITRPRLPRWRPKVDQPASPEPSQSDPPDHIPSPPKGLRDVSVHITGIGGTGVVTVAQLIGTAAMLEGAQIHGLDQIGLSQKAGPVVSDLRITHEGTADSSRVGSGQADLLLAFDLLVAASWTGLAAAESSRTAVVGSTSITPPGEKVAHPEIDMPTAEELLARVEEVTLTDQRHWVDAETVTTALFGNSVSANVFVVAMAVQAGLLPVDPTLVEEAIALNGVSVESNLAAFKWGRWQVANPDVVANEVARRSAPAGKRIDLPADITERISAVAESDEPLVRDLSRLVDDLIGYQNRAIAERFLRRVEVVSEAERAVTSGSRELTTAVAIGFHKLLAYKDEYEVARLMLDDSANSAVDLVAKPGDKVAWRLHPPTLKALGVHRKISISTSWRPAISLLARAKRLRGTRLDPFSRNPIRRMERELPAEYETALDHVLADLDATNLSRAVEVAELADLVRGFEELKCHNVEIFRHRLAELTAESTPGVDVG